jgi:hypothetical protein
MGFFIRRIAYGVAGLIGMFVYMALRPLPFAKDVALCVAYTVAVFGIILMSNSAVFFSDNARPLKQVLLTHLAFLAGVAVMVRGMIILRPYLPPEFTHRDPVRHTSWASTCELIAILLLSAWERWLLVKKPKPSAAQAMADAKIDELLKPPAPPAEQAPVSAPVRSAAPAPMQFAEPTWTPLTMSAEQAAPMLNGVPMAIPAAAQVAAPRLSPEPPSAPLEFGSSKSSLFMNSTGEEYNEFLKLMQQGIRPFRKPGISVKDEFELWLANKAKGPKAKKERAGLGRLVPSGKSGD